MAFLSGIAGSLGGVGLGAAVVEVAVNTTALTTGLEKAKAEVAASTNAMSASTKAIGTGFIVAGAAAAIGISKAISATVDLAGETKSLQRITGQSAESASSLIFVAEKFGVSTQSLAQGFGLLAKNISLNAPAIAKYGLEVRNADGSTKDLNDILAQAADKYVALGGGLQGAAFAQEVFGRGGKALIPILAQGSEGIQGFLDEAQRYGVVLSQDMVDKARELAIAQRDLGTAFEGLKISIGSELVPVMTAFVHGLTEAVVVFNAIPGPIKAGVLVFTALTGALFLIQKAVALVVATWGPLTAVIGAASTAMTLQEAAAIGDAAGLTALAAGATEVEAAEIAATVSTEALTGATAGFGVAMLALAPELVAVGLIIAGLAGAIDGVHDKMAQAAVDTGVFGSATAGAIDPVTGLVSGIDALTGSSEDAAAALEAQKVAQDSLAGGIVGLVGDMASVNAAQKEVNDLRRHGNLDTARGRDALIALASATQGYNSDLQTELDNIRLVPGHFQAAKDEVAHLGRQMGLTGGELKAFVSGALQALQDKANSAKTAMDGLAHSMASLHDKQVNIDIITHYTHTGKLD